MDHDVRHRSVLDYIYRKKGEDFMQMIKVKLVGKADITTEYNGVKYSFTVKNPIKEIPVEVYNYIQQCGDVFSADIQPYFEPPKEEKPVVEKPVETKPIVKESEHEKQSRSPIRRPLKSVKDRK